MSRKTILGYEVASPERQRRMAIIVFAVFSFIMIGAIGAFVGPNLYRHLTYIDAEGTVTALETKCHYSIRRLSKRGPAHLTT